MCYTSLITVLPFQICHACWLQVVHFMCISSLRSRLSQFAGHGLKFMLDLRQFPTTATLPSKETQALNLTVVTLSMMHFCTDQHISYCSGSPVSAEGTEQYSHSSTLDLHSMSHQSNEIRDGLIAEKKASNLLPRRIFSPDWSQLPSLHSVGSTHHVLCVHAARLCVLPSTI